MYREMCKGKLHQTIINQITKSNLLIIIFFFRYYLLEPCYVYFLNKIDFSFEKKWNRSWQCIQFFFHSLEFTLNWNWYKGRAFYLLKKNSIFHVLEIHTVWQWHVFERINNNMKKKWSNSTYATNRVFSRNQIFI